MSAVDHVLIGQLAADAVPHEVGAASWPDALASALRISMKEANRRVASAQVLGPRRALTGEPLVPVLERTAAAQARGELGAEHVAIIERFFAKLPGHVDYQARELAEADLATVGAGLRPEHLTKVADRLMLLLDEDGPMPNDKERARRRFFTVGAQGSDGMSKVHGLLDPQARATLDAVLAKLAAPGMCNPGDENPCVEGEPSRAHQAGDTRTTGQRNHDALTAMGRALLASGELGQHNGLPSTIVVTTTLKELESAAGFAVTGGGTLLPMADLIAMAATSHHYLVVYENHREVPMYLGRAKRLATPAQRLVLYSRDRGCTRPGCTASAYRAQVHHAAKDWADDGQTNIDELTLACGPDNRLVEKGGWRTRIRPDGRIEWLPPPAMDTGQDRVNNYHRPEKYLLPEEDQGS
ncbi:HNH endonuclease signature motif containing protein [Mycobacterium sp. IDR2000157661]|uniref:HNH endonuclease signature motif containing protein n=1 Tax=Mycobacterium sp. IDR2000157661 TaxID=2867005 RepID=UPI001EEA4B9B|nr:HNH endonuclease signature motif containing protein [Mycobacterium sp. IDR2000157661]